VKKIAFDKQERAEIVGKIQRYFADEMEQTIGTLPSEMLLTFFAEAIGGHFYNQGLRDAQAVFTRALDGVSDELYGLEQRDARR
jgi:uncharacterized protein (DUF2164 family)